MKMAKKETAKKKEADKTEDKAVKVNGEASKEEPSPKETDLVTLDDVREQVKQIEKTVSSKEPRYLMRVLRTFASTRKRLNQNVLRKLIVGYFPPGSSSNRETLLSFLDEPMDSDSVSSWRPKSTKSQSLMLPETEIYLHLLLLVYLLDNKRNSDGVRCGEILMTRLHSFNRRTMDYLSAKAYFYYARAYELTDQLHQIRSFLHAKLRTATLRSNSEGQATLLNLLLRNYLHYNLYDQADKLVAKSTFPESASNNEWARFLYYMGRIKAIQLEYSEAHKHLLQAIRKAPQHSAVGFKQAVHKLEVTVQLLLGEIPDRSLFRHTTLRKSLHPYFQLTQAVRMGNLGRFNEVLENWGRNFQAENTYTLIVRLRHNVIKTGVRMINLSYSRIALADVATKLQLDSPEDAEFIVAKAIRDGVIEATINHEKAYVQSKENIDIYSTAEPIAAFHQRISFCLDIHNQSVKAMRFPPKNYSKDLETAEERREREQQDLELAKEMADEDDDPGFS